MTRRTLTTAMLSTLILGVVVSFPPDAIGQANAPMEVEASQPAAAAGPRDLQAFARQMVSRPEQPAKLPADPLTPLPAVRPAAAAPLVAPVASPASATPAAPVVSADPNESKPLGTAAPARRGDGKSITTGSGWGVTQTIFALAFVVGLILVGRQLIVRFTGRPAAAARSRVVEVLSRVSVGPRQHVVLIRLGGRIIVVSDSAGQMRLLANLEEPEEVASILKSVTASRPTSISESFSQLMGKFDQDFDKAESVRQRDEGRDVHEHQTDRARDQLSGLLARVRAMAGKGGA